MTEDPPRQNSSVMTVVAHVTEAVREGRLAAGQRLVEMDWARRLDVARSTVREAFQRLEAEGLLSSERHRGYQVRVLTRRRLREIYEVRASLEGLAARLAAADVHADPAELNAIVGALEDARARKDIRAFTRANRAFHELIRHRCGNDLITELLGSLEQSVYSYQFRLLVDSDTLFEGQDDHLDIARALLRGDGDAAEAAAKRHAARSLEDLLALPDALFAAG